MQKRTKTELIVVHCSATPPNMDIGAKEIRQWHTLSPPKGNGWADIGYHAVIRRDGTIENGRPLEAIGAHVAGHNYNSVGVCLVGGIDRSGKPQDNFTDDQMEALGILLKTWMTHFKTNKIVGHCDLDPGKACPSFDVAAWLKKEGIA